MDQRGGSRESREDNTVASRITINVYLDDGYEGGEFAFVNGVQMDGTFEEEIMRPDPKAGDVVLFYQGAPEFSHAVLPLVAGPKTIMRSDVMYKFANKESADVGGQYIQPAEPVVPEEDGYVSYED